MEPTRSAAYPNGPISRNGHVVLFSEEFRQGFDLPTSIIRPIRGEDGTIVLKRQVDSLLRPAHGMVYPNAGLLDVYKAVIREAGTAVDRDQHVDSLPAPVSHRLTLPPGYLEFLDSHRSGLIQVGPNVSVAEMVVGTCLSWPSKRSIVLASKRRQLKAFERSCRRVCSEWDIAIERRKCSDEDEVRGQLHTCTWIDAADTDFAHYDIAFVLDAVDIAHDRGQTALCQSDAKFRLFGFLRAEQRLSPRQWDLIHAALGPASVLELPSPRSQAAWVQTAMISVNPPPIDPATSETKMHRRGCWKNYQRNRRIAKLTRAVTMGDAIGVEGKPAIAPWMQATGNRPQRVTVCAANLEHALALLRLMPGAHLATSLDDADLDDLAPEDRALVRERPATFASRLTVTDGTRWWSSDYTDCIIWAASGPGIGNGPALLSRGQTRRRVLVIDFYDRHHDQLRDWSRQRRRIYESRGWFPVDMPESAGRVREFLRRRPQPASTSRRRGRRGTR